MPLTSPIQHAQAMSAYLQTMLDALAMARLYSFGSDGKLMEAIEYEATELEDGLATIEAERTRDLDERGIRYLPNDDVEAIRKVLNAAWLAEEALPIVSLVEHHRQKVAEAKADMLKEYERVVWPELAAE